MTQGFDFSGTSLAGLPGVLTGSASAAASGSSEGISGLFSGLVESNAAAPSGADSFFASLSTGASASSNVPDLATLLPGMPDASNSLAMLQSLLAQAGVQVSSNVPADGAVIPGVQQSDGSLQTLAQAVQQVLAQAPAGADLTDAAQIKQVLQNLGVPAEKQDGLVATVKDLLAKLKSKLNLDDTQLASLAPVALAVVAAPMLQNAQGAPLVTADKPLTLTFAVDKTAVPDVARAGNAIRVADAIPAAASMAREIAGITSDTKPTDAAENPQPQAAADTQAPDSALPAVAVTIDPVGVTVRDVIKTPTSVSARDSIATPAKTVAAADILPAAKGEVKFTWKGEDTAQPVAAKSATEKAEAPIADVKPSQNDALAQTALHTSAARPQADAGDASFADKVAEYQQKVDLAKRYDVAGQAVVQMKSLIDQGGGQIRVKLNPPELGEIHVDLVVKNGEVTGKISASDPAVVNALAGDVKQFGDGLRQAGFKLGNEGLNFMLNQQNPQQQQNQQQQQFAQQGQSAGGWQGQADAAIDETAEISTPAAWVSPDRLLDVNI